MKTTDADSWSDIGQLCDIGIDIAGHEVKVTRTYISWSSEFASYLEDYLEDYLMYENHTLG